MTDHIASLAIEVRAETDDARQKLKDLEKLSNSFAGRITGAFEGAIFSGRSFGDTLRGLALDLARLTFRSAFQPVSQALGGFLAQGTQGLFGFAKGGVVGQPMPVPFASGGVIAAPVTFPLGGGRTGLAGEAGAEAILPLARGSDGRLGVRAQAAGGAPVINISIAATDAESFRRSEAQVTALLARAVARGQRSL